MASTQPSKRERQPISIPFLWEEKPGTPKRDWNPVPTARRQLNPCPLPDKLVVSVPFVCEEKPGTPLHSFVQPQHDIIVSSPPKYEGDGLSYDSDQSSETCSFKTSDSFGSAQAASETDSCSVGPSFLEWLFPLLATSNVPNKVSGGMEKDTSPREVDVRDKELMSESNRSRVGKPLLTLEELIVMSRRRSCQRKVNRIHRQPSMHDFVKRNTWGCFIFGSGKSGSQMKWKIPVQLKLV